MVTYVAFHLALSKQAYSVCTQALRDDSFKREGKKGERQDKESDMQTWNHRLVRLQGGDALHMFTQTFTSHMKWRKRKEKVQWVVVGGLWSEIKQTAPLQRTSFHLCDVKSKLINKGSRFQGVLSQIQGVEAFYFHQRRIPTWVNSRLASAQLSLFWYRSLFYSLLSEIKKGLAGSRQTLHNCHQSPFPNICTGFRNARNRGSGRKWVSVPLQKEIEIEKLMSMMMM